MFTLLSQTEENIALVEGGSSIYCQFVLVVTVPDLGAVALSNNNPDAVQQKLFILSPAADVAVLWGKTRRRWDGLSFFLYVILCYLCVS